ncbi:MAG: hypothetical protein ACM30D_06395 [Hyphomicrobiales bacterium]|jgi:hypothetical protein|nr:hypothetical protein [Xanthobacteraceae bacterium]
MARLARFAAIAAVASLECIGPALSQDWPTRPVTMVVPFAAGDRGAAPAMQDLIAGRIDYQCPDTPIASPALNLSTLC